MLQVAVVLLSVVVVWAWQFLNWAWFEPRKIESLLRKQGMKGSSYKFLFGDSKETSLMYERAYSKPIGFNDDISPRVMPNIFYTIQKYGNNSFTWAGPRPRIFIMDPDVVRDVLNRYRVYQKNFRISNKIVQMIATGLAALEGEEWTKSRSKLKPAFNVDKLKPMVPEIRLCCENTLNEWKEMASKEGFCVVDVFHHLEKLTGAVLARLMFSSTYTEEIKRTFLQLSELAFLSRVASKTFTVPGEHYLPTQTYRRSKEIDNDIRVSLTSMFNERLKRKQSGSKDLLDLFLEELYEGKVTNDGDRRRLVEDAIKQCKIFFFAGFETSSNSLCWTMILLSVHQDWQTRAREEVFQVLGGRKEITSDDLGKLKIVTMILNEALRLYPPIMELTRLVEEETKTKEVTIPRGSLVTCPTLMLHRDTDVWGKDAREFRPERFAEGTLKAANGKAAYFPFGWGPRICIGQNFATMEAKTFLAMLLLNFSFELSPEYTHAPVVAFTIQPQYGAPIVLRKL